MDNQRSLWLFTPAEERVLVLHLAAVPPAQRAMLYAWLEQAQFYAGVLAMIMDGHARITGFEGDEPLIALTPAGERQVAQAFPALPAAPAPVPDAAVLVAADALAGAVGEQVRLLAARGVPVLADLIDLLAAYAALRGGGDDDHADP